MAKIFITNKNYNNNWAYANVIRYVTQNITETGCIGGTNYDFVDPSFAITNAGRSWSEQLSSAR